MTQTQTVTESRKSNVELVREIHARFSRGDLASCGELVTDDIEVVLHPMGQTFRGREEFLQFMQLFHTAFPDIAITHTNLVVEGDQVAVEFIWNGTHTGPLMSPGGAIAPTGKRVERSPVAEFMKLRNGKVARIANYQDMASWMRQLGLV